MSASDPYELLISLGLAVAQIYRPNPCQEQACAELLATLDGSSLASDVVRPAIDDALRQAEDSMKRTAALMQKMRALRNRSVTINRLPSELLADIFWRISSPTVIARLISLTHVCTHWRAVALDDARLWATVWIECDPESDTLQTSCVPRMTEYLRRSRSHPLFVNIGHLPQSSMLACIETLQAHLHRIQTFWLQTETVDQMLHCLTRLRTAAVRLEDLRLEVDPFESDDSDSEASSVSPFQSHACDLFGGHTPLLRSLYLSEVSNLSIPTTLRNLRHFTLVRQTMPITHMDAFLDVLEIALVLRPCP
ncbi:uncharacterized protein B0H18DRAFT_352226 [Fomitopsis serialis]|uniref:uncharacterized protein n=1 Tax=Fomitopsis serialis TaxID=139415 RepID=UPI0020074A81|nr:uncharacterized protein B0H18DRAFT_352226 [Neoantrodia serialis]KAH9926156.1 hypothetical protein B0H18DRAFT_352226 [Neoantrodia serialis]